MKTALLDRFVGSLIGQAVADGLGAPYEGLPPELVFIKGPAGEIVKNPSGRTLYYTDDTQMAIGVAETLIESGEIREDVLCAAFAENYDPDRGYGQGARRVLRAIVKGGDWRRVAETQFPGGSLGNGAAMRAAPVGLLFCHDLDRVAEQAALSAMPTHVHPIGIDGARLIALAVALAARSDRFDRGEFLAELADRAETEEFQWQLSNACQISAEQTLAGFGNGVEAHRSVVTAILCFANSPDDYSSAVRQAIGQGNDTDTLAAMAGAISGARLGIAGIPANLVESLEDNPKGRAYIRQLAEKLHETHTGLC